MRPVREDEVEAYLHALLEAFGDPPRQEAIDSERRILEPERTLAVFDQDRIVATAGIYTRELTVPGAVLPVAHVTLVSVEPTYRRRGLLRRMMRRQLEDIRSAGREPVAALWASEGTLYGRYGYGLAVQRFGFTARTRELQVAADPGKGRLRSGKPAEVREDLAAVYETVRASRPGLSGRPGAWWEQRLEDPEHDRDGASPLRALLHEGPDGVDGYALWRMKPDWDESGPNGEVRVKEVQATNPAAHAALWRFLLNVDLTRRLTFGFAAADDPLPHLVNEPRRLTTQTSESLWVRVVDVPAALAARRYAAPVDVVLAVTDELVPENTGRWRLTGNSTDATCVPTDDEPDLELGITELGAVYLGGTTLTALAGAGRVTELRPGTLAPASTAFGWYRAPSSIEVF